MSELRTNRIVPRDGLPSGASGGGIIQVVQSVVTSSSTGTGATAASVMTCSITPTSSANKILVMVDTNVGSSNGYNTVAYLYRGTGGSGTKIYFGDADGSRPRVSRTATAYQNTGTTYHQIPLQIHYLDSPATTSQITYDLRLASYSTEAWTFNRSYSDQNTSEYDGLNASSMTLMEVCG